MCGFGSSSASAPTTQFSTQTTTASPQAQAMYNQSWSKAQSVANRPFTPYSNDPNAFVAPMNGVQLSAVNDIYGMQNAGQPFYQAAPGMAFASGNTSAAGLAPSYMSPYLNSVAAATMGILGQQQGQQQNQLSGDIAKNGQWGNSRSGVERALLSGQQNLATANTISNLYNTGYNTALGAAQTDLNRQLQAAQGLSSAGQSGANNLLQAGTVGQQTQQAGLQALYNQFLMQQQYPFQVAQFLSSTAAGLGPGYGGTTSGYQSSQSPLSFFGNPLSDPSLKVGAEGAKPEVIGETNDGQDIYRYRVINPDTGEVGPVQIGLMADEVQQRRPDAIGDYKGFKTVDYAKATDGAARMGGGVMGRGDYADGGGAFDNLMNALSGHGYIDGSTWENRAVGEPLDITPAVREMPVEHHTRRAPPNRTAIAPHETAITFDPPRGGLGLDPMPAQFTPFPRREIAFSPPSTRGFGSAPLPARFTDFPHVERREVIAFDPPAYGLGEGPRPAEFTRFGRLASGDVLASGYADGGAIDDLLRSHEAMYSGMGQRPAGLVPTVQIPVAKLDAPSLHFADMPQKQAYGVGQAAKDALGLIESGKGLYKEGSGLWDMLEKSNLVSGVLPSHYASGGLVYDERPDMTQGPVATQMPVAKLNAPELSFGSDGQKEKSGGLGDMVKTAAGLAGTAKTLWDIGSTVGPALMALSDRRLKTGVGYAKGGVAPSDDDIGDDIWNSVEHQESGGKQFDKSGRPLTSSAGAIGVAQVMPGTLPEAARYAGLEPDLDRLRNDPGYGRKVGRAYLNHQYQTFHDPDMAVAAYNAGPGGVERAMAKANINGGSWRDYLPSETKAYLPAVMGDGRALALAPKEERPSNAGLDAMPAQAPARGGLAPAGEDMTPAQGISGMIRGTPASGLGEKALDFATSERFLVPLLTGLGAMAGSGSRFLAPAVLQGLGAGAQAYMNVPKVQSEIMKNTLGLAATRFKPLESGNFYDNVLGRVVSPQERMSSMQGMFNGVIGSGSSGGLAPATAGASTSEAKPAGEPAAVTAATETARKVNAPAAASAAGSGTSAILDKAMTDPGVAALMAKADAYEREAAALIDKPFVENAGERANQLRGLASNYRTLAIQMRDKIAEPELAAAKAQQEVEVRNKNELVEVPGKNPGEPSRYALKSDVLAGNTVPDNAPIAKQPASIEKQQEGLAAYRQQMSDNASVRQQARANLTALADVLKDYEPGRFAEQKAAIVGALKSAGFDIDPRAAWDTAKFEEFVKNSMASVLQQAAAAGDTRLRSEFESVLKANANPSLQPEANRAIIGKALGLLDWEDKHYNDFVDWSEKNPYAYDRTKFERDWMKQNPTKGFIESATKNVPVRGERLPPINQLKVGYRTVRDGATWEWDGSKFNEVK